MNLRSLKTLGALTKHNPNGQKCLVQVWATLACACTRFHTGCEALTVQAAGVSCESGAAFVLEAGWRRWETGVHILLTMNFWMTTFCFLVLYMKSSTPIKSSRSQTDEGWHTLSPLSITATLTNQRASLSSYMRNRADSPFLGASKRCGQLGSRISGEERNSLRSYDSGDLNGGSKLAKTKLGGKKKRIKSYQHVESTISSFKLVVLWISCDFWLLCGLFIIRRQKSQQSDLTFSARMLLPKRQPILGTDEARVA